MARGAVRFSSLRIANSSWLRSTTESFLVRPTRAQRSRIASGGQPPAAQRGQGGHAGIVPAVDQAFVDQPPQLALRGQGVGQVEARELDLLRQVDAVDVVEEPVVERPVILELEGAQRVGYALDRVGLAVGPVVHGVDAPLRARAVVLRVEDPVEHRVAQVHVRRGHVDLRAERVRSVLELAVLHPFEQVEVLFNGAVSVRTLAARFVPPPAVRARFLRTQAADVGLALADQFQRPFVELVEVVRRVERFAAPVETEPAHVALDGLDVLGVFRGRVRVVEAEVAVAAVLLGDAEVEQIAFAWPMCR